MAEGGGNVSARYPHPDLWGIVVEGAVDHFCGRPFERNPYTPGRHADAWEYGWEDAAWLLDIRGEQEARRWLSEAA